MASGTKRKAPENEGKGGFKSPETKRKFKAAEAESHCEEFLKEKGFYFLSNKIGNEWKEFLAYLDTKWHKIQQYELDEKCTQDRIVRGLVEWNKREIEAEKSPKKRIQMLFEALDEIDRKDVITKIRQKFNIPDLGEDEHNDDRNVDDTTDSMESKSGTENENTSRVTDASKAEDEDPGKTNIAEVEMEEGEHKDKNKDHTTGTTESKSGTENKNTSRMTNANKDEEDDHDTGVAESDDEIEMRSYQLELAHDAAMGNNCIILAGTGSGKTRIAIYLMKKHLDKHPTAKILFMARTIPLVNQQYEAITTTMPKNKIFMTCSEEGNSDNFPLYVKNVDYNIFVVTPQILVNCLNSKELLISDFSFLVFDECHHTKQRNPYNWIMRFYRKTKFADSNIKTLPQIVGLTASYGTDRAKNVEDALQSLLKLMARMDVHTLSTVVKCKEEYQKCVVIPQKVLIPMKPRNSDPIRDVIEKAMNRIENELKILKLDVWTELLKTIPGERRGDRYLPWLQNLRTAATNQFSNCQKEATFALACYDHLMMYFEALEVNYMLDPSEVEKYLSDQLESPYLNRSEDSQGEKEQELTAICKDLRDEVKQCISKGGSENPHLAKLVEIIQKLLEEDKDSKFFVFVKTRATAIALGRFLSNHVTPVSYLTGRGRFGNDGLNESQQNRVIEDLKNGAISGIVSTTVGEEGLNIISCNAVIRYNAVGNEISSIQSRGRSRRTGGKSYLIADRKNVEREAINVEREYMMMQAQDRFCSMTAADIAKIIDGLQRDIHREEKQEEEKEELSKRSKKKESFEIKCRKCYKFIISDTGLRCYRGNHYIIVDPGFYERITWKPHPKRSTYEGLTNTHLMYGKKPCEHEWGVLVKMETTKCALLKSTSVIINGRGYKRWKDVPFDIQPMNEAEDIKSLLFLNEIDFEKIPKD